MPISIASTNTDSNVLRYLLRPASDLPIQARAIPDINTSQLRLRCTRKMVGSSVSHSSRCSQYPLQDQQCQKEEEHIAKYWRYFHSFKCPMQSHQQSQLHLYK